MAYVITVDEDKCIGCGACTSCDNFELIDGKSKAKKSKVEEIGCNQEASDICPVQAISVESTD